MTKSMIQWRVVFGLAVLMEIVLIVALIPVSLLVQSQAVRIPIACLVVSFAVMFWGSRWIHSRLLLHGLLIVVVATMIYLALVVGVGGGLSAAISRYGIVLFVGFNALRLVGTLLAAAIRQHRRYGAPASVSAA